MTPPLPASNALDWRLAPWAARVLVALFVLVVAVPGLATVSGLGMEPPGNEAEAAVDSGWSARAARFDGRFAFRDTFVEAQSWLRYKLLRVSTLPTVWRGRDGWWFLASDGALESTLNEPPFTAAEIETWRATLQRTADFLAGRGIAYVFAVAPEKATVYPEFLPGGMHPRRGPTRTDQLVADLRAHSTVPVVDLRDGLLAAKPRQRLFHLTDTHWNDVGAVVAYRQILQALGSEVPGLEAPAADDAFELTPSHDPGGDLAWMLGLYRTLGETSLRMVPRQPRRARVVEPSDGDTRFAVPRVVTVVDDARLPRAVVYRDSFGSALVPLLAEHFQRMVALWEYDVVPATIREEQPQVVIQEWVGRRLYNRPPYDAVAADPAAVAEIASSSRAGRR